MELAELETNICNAFKGTQEELAIILNTLKNEGIIRLTPLYNYAI